MLYVRTMGLTTVLSVQSMRCHMFRSVTEKLVSNSRTLNTRAAHTCVVLSQCNTLVGHWFIHSLLMHTCSKKKIFYCFSFIIIPKLFSQKRCVLVAAHLYTLWTACL